MTFEEKEYMTRDYPAERGLTINNILLSLVIVGGTIFGGFVSWVLNNMNTTISAVQKDVAEMKTASGISSNEIKHIHQSLAECRTWHTSMQNEISDIKDSIRIHTKRDHP